MSFTRTILLFIYIILFKCSFAQCPEIRSTVDITINQNDHCAINSPMLELTYTTFLIDPTNEGDSLIISWGDGTYDSSAVPVGVLEFTVSYIHQFLESEECFFPINAIYKSGSATCLERHLSNAENMHLENEGDGYMQLVGPNGTSLTEVCSNLYFEFIFNDNTKLSCFSTTDPPFFNMEHTWQQLVYNTSVEGDKIPNVSVNGVQLTDNEGLDIISDYQDPRGIYQVEYRLDAMEGWGYETRPTLNITSTGENTEPGDEFEITLRYWNSCNPYDDPDIAGPPADSINGDHPPVETTSVIKIKEPLPPNTGEALSPFICWDNNEFNMFDAIFGYDVGGSWLDDDNTMALSDSILDASILEKGTYEFTYFKENECGSSSTIVSVNIDGKPEIKLNVDYLKIPSSQNVIISGSGDLDSTLLEINRPQGVFGNLKNDKINMFPFELSDTLINETSDTLAIEYFFNVYNNGCKGLTDSVLVLVTPEVLTSLKEIKESRIYPNPASDILIVEDASLYDFNLYNSEGEQVFVEQVTNGGNLIMDLRTLPKGFYYLFTKRGKKVITYKIVIN